MNRCGPIGETSWVVLDYLQLKKGEGKPDWLLALKGGTLSKMQIGTCKSTVCYHGNHKITEKLWPIKIWGFPEQFMKSSGSVQFPQILKSNTISPTD